MKKIVIEKEKCMQCGACVGVDGEHFDFADDGFSTVISQENLDSVQLVNAIESCPTGAISIKDSCDCGCGCDDKETCECENCDCKN